MATATDRPVRTATTRSAPLSEPLKGAFFWLSAFYVVYCARPEDWLPALKYVPLAKISGVFALVALMISAGRSKRSFRDLPREATYLLGIISFLYVSAILSPVWKGGAFFKNLDFTKILIAWALTFLAITSFARLRKIIFIQAASVAVIALVSLVKGHNTPRLEGVIGGIYSNPNDLAFAIVLSLPFCFAFLLSTRSVLRKGLWAASMLVMCTALFLTASRAGFIDLVVTGCVCLWLFGIKGKRIHLVVAAAVVAIVIGFGAGKQLKNRFMAISGHDLENGIDISAHGSYEQRRYLMIESVKTVGRYPLGIGFGNFPSYSGTWREVHVAYLQIAVEGGIGAFVLYLLFFGRGFANLRQLRRLPGYDAETELFAGALYASLIGFVVGACFAPEAYQYFPYFAVAYTSVLLAVVKEKEPSSEVLPATPLHPSRRRLRGAGDFAPARGGVAKYRAASGKSTRYQR